MINFIRIVFLSFLIILFISQLFAPNFVKCQEYNDLDLISRWPYGTCKAICADTSYAYVGNGGAIEIISITNLNSLQKISSISTPGMVNNISISKNYLYVATGYAGLRIIDIENPGEPKEAGYLDNDQMFFDLFVQDDLVYVAAGDSGLRIINVSAPSQPIEMNSIKNFGEAEAIFVVDTLAYIAAGDSGLKIINISNTDTLDIIGTYNINQPDQFISSFANDVAISGHYAYVLLSGYGLRIIDIINPRQPVEKSFVSLPHDHGISGTGVDIFIDNNYAYVGFFSDATAGIYIVDISDPEYPIGYHLIDQHMSFDGIVSENICFFSTGDDGLQIYDNSIIPNTILWINNYKTEDYSRDVFVRDSLIYLAADGSGLLVLKNYKTTNPVEVGRYSGLDIEAKKVFVTEDFTYFISSSDSFYVLDTKNPSSIIRRSSTYISGIYYWNEFYVYQEFAYFLRYGTSSVVLSIFNIEDPDQAIFKSDIILPGSSFVINRGIFVTNNYAFVTAGQSGLRIIDITDKSAPTEIGTFITDKTYLDVFVCDNYAFLTDAYYGFSIIDISDPHHPFEISTIEIDGHCRSIVVDDKFAYIASDYYGLVVINIRNIESPLLEAFYLTSENAHSVFVSDNKIYLADGEDGVYIFDSDFLQTLNRKNKLSTVVSFKLFQNYPNPFNQSTMIYFQLFKNSHIQISVFDMLGREITEIENRYKSMSEYSVKWDTNGLSSGIYYIVLQTEFGTQIKKAILIK